ncbi:MAG: hypothetical protein ACHQIM_15325 [Sphingobacteriales bacterium]
MKKYLKKGLIIAAMMYPSILFAQTGSTDLKKMLLDSLASPNLLNAAEAKYMAALKNTDTAAYNFIRQLNLKFKTFQAGALPPGLGFSYQYDNSWTKNSKKNGPGDASPVNHNFSQSFNLDLNGNVAFKAAYNPSNFLESKFTYNGTFFWGGQLKQATPAEGKANLQLVKDRIKALAAGDQAKADALERQLVRQTPFTNQYYIGVNGNASYESNQQFTKTQFVPGLLINAGASSFTERSTLSWFNIPDYPFALIRYLTQTDDHIEVSGAAIPSVLFGLDYVVPTGDSLRQAVTGALNPFTRLRFEASFKTKAARAVGQVFWFSADYRWYHQLDASPAVINAHIAYFNYFTCALSASNGFFVSYSTGQLPFDQKSTAVYSLGFNYNLGNWK